MGHRIRSGASRRAVAGAVAAALALAFAACGSDDSESSTSSAGSDKPAAQKVDVAGAKAAVAEYTGKPSAFPVDEALPKPFPKGKKFGYLQCQPPVCALYGQILQQPIKLLGGSLKIYKSGSSASGVQTAAASALADKPAALLLPSIAAETLGTTLKPFGEANIPVSGISIPRGDSVGVTTQIQGKSALEKAGGLLADWVVANKGAKADVVLYTTPELDFSSVFGTAFPARMKELCPSCKVRIVPISVTTIGTTAPTRVVSDLQSHPDTNTAVIATYEAATGLPAALKAAGLDPTVIGYAPTPGNLQDIKDGKLTAALALDLPVGAWTQVDMTIRKVLGVPFTKGEEENLAPMQFLQKADITFDPSKGWTGYPDFAERFAKLWATK